MRFIIEPTEFGDTADKFDEGHDDKVLEAWSLVGKVGEDIISNIDALRDGEIVPVRGDQLRE